MTRHQRRGTATVDADPLLKVQRRPLIKSSTATLKKVHFGVQRRESVLNREGRTRYPVAGSYGRFRAASRLHDVKRRKCGTRMHPRALSRVYVKSRRYYGFMHTSPEQWSAGLVVPATLGTRPLYCPADARRPTT